MKHFISLGGQEFSARAKGYYTTCRIKWIPSPTWVWSGFTFKELIFLSGDNFGLVLDEIGDIHTYFLSIGDKGLCIICVFLAQDDLRYFTVRWSSRWGGNRALQDLRVRGMEVVAPCPAWLCEFPRGEPVWGYKVLSLYMYIFRLQWTPSSSS